MDKIAPGHRLLLLGLAAGLGYIVFTLVSLYAEDVRNAQRMEAELEARIASVPPNSPCIWVEEDPYGHHIRSEYARDFRTGLVPDRSTGVSTHTLPNDVDYAVCPGHPSYVPPHPAVSEHYEDLVCWPEEDGLCPNEPGYEPLYFGGANGQR